MDLQAYIDEIKLELTGNVLQLELPDSTIGTVVNKALREIQRYTDETRLITVPFSKCIDLTKSKVSSIISSEDAANGYRGVIAEELTDDFDYIADCERLVDMEEKVEDFKKLRWYVIINVGVDLYRMLFLTCEGDIEATRKFKYYVNKLALEEYFRDLLSDIRILGVLKRELK